MTVAWSAPGVVDPGVVARLEELSDLGLDDRAIAAELEISLRTLQRVRAALRQPVVDPPSPAARRVRGRGDRTKWVQVRVSEEELAELKRLAESIGVSVGEYVRRRALDDS